MDGNDKGGLGEMSSKTREQMGMAAMGFRDQGLRPSAFGCFRFEEEKFILIGHRHLRSARPKRGTRKAFQVHRPKTCQFQEQLWLDK